MPIPFFDSNSVLPPHLGDPRTLAQLSPFPCTTLELCQRFSGSDSRVRILNGLLAFRAILAQTSFTGFQWLDGSFLEDIETSEGRSPRDLDVVTFFDPQDAARYQEAQVRFPILLDRLAIKTAHSLDHFFVNLTYNPMVLVENARYWSGLFSHRRNGVWKGMLRLELLTPADDVLALNFLGSLP